MVDGILTEGGAGRPADHAQAGRRAAGSRALRCARCGGPLPADGGDADDCPACSTRQPEAPSTWVLLRLWRFAPCGSGRQTWKLPLSFISAIRGVYKLHS